MIKKHIPNTITLLNLSSGAIAVLAAYEGNYRLALVCIILSAILDFFDGLSARLLKAYSPIGKELDSLADVISFGLAPSMIAYSLMADAFGIYAFASLLIAAFSALRLAIFNIDERQTSSFIGMPTPANALLWIGMAYGYGEFFIYNPYITLVLVCLTSYLLVSPLPMFSLKIKNFSFGDNLFQFLLVIFSLILIIIFRLNCIAWIVGLYILLSVVKVIIDVKK